MLPVGFSACAVDSKWCKACFIFTQSAGPYGTLIIVLLTCFLYTIRIKSFAKKARNFLLAFSQLALFLGGFAVLNEFVTKKAIKATRPSHTYILTQSHSQVRPDSLSGMTTADRRTSLQQMIASADSAFRNIDTDVLDHWVAEAGYSFPSGHSFNAFLLACVLAFSIFHLHDHRRRKWFFVPFVWAVMVAVSRVAIGVHSALDVSFGAALGLLVANLFIYFDLTRRWIIHKVHLEENKSIQ